MSNTLLTLPAALLVLGASLSPAAYAASMGRALTLDTVFSDCGDEVVTFPEPEPTGTGDSKLQN